jgi:hypothetical protein
MTDRHFLDADALVAFLRDHGVDQLFHANTVETSLSFLRHGHLLGREQSLLMGAPMTPQYTDEVDRRYGIFNDLFFNMKDLHVLFRSANNYGPILFKIGVDKFEEFIAATSGRVGVTTGYLPHRWQDSDSASDRWHTDVTRIFDATHPDIVVHIPMCDLRFVDEIVIDEIPDRPLFYPQVVAMLLNCAAGNGLKIQMSPRRCRVHGCNCCSLAAVQSRSEKYHAGKWQNQFGSLDDVA